MAKVWPLFCYLYPYQNYSTMCCNTMCMHTISSVHQWQCNHFHNVPNISAPMTTFSDWTLHSLCSLCTKIFSPYKWIPRLCISSWSSNSLLLYCLCKCHHLPSNDTNSTTYRCVFLQLLGSCERYWLGIVEKL